MKTQFTLSLLLLVVMQGCMNDDIYLTGNGEVKSHEISINSFEKVSIEGIINLRITQSPVQSISIETTDLIFNYMEWEVTNNTLYVGFDKNVRFRDNNIEIWLNVSVPDLKAISASGINEIISEGDLDLSQLKISLSGTGIVKLFGSVSDQLLEISGTATINNYNFHSQNTNIDISGMGDIEISCEKNLNLNVSGEANVHYIGHPAISQSSSGILELVDKN